MCPDWAVSLEPTEVESVEEAETAAEDK